MIRVCDAIMGTGKSSAAITYLNEHKDEKFIYITPYLTEANRIYRGCPKLRFIEPSDKIKEYHFRKSEHTEALIEEGANIATTHQAFKRYTPEMLENIQRHGYTLIIDENVDILEVFDFHEDDLQMAINSGYINDAEDAYSIKRDDYSGYAFKELFGLLKSRDLIRMKDRDDKTLFYWALPPELLTSFKDVFILTYLFEGQSLSHLMNIYNIPHEFVGIEKTEDGVYRFGSLPGHVPEYVSHLKDMIHILDNDKLNSVGDDYHSLSKSWHEKNEITEEGKQLKNNLYNYFNNIHADIPADKKLWGTYKAECNYLKGKGYTKGYLPFNAKATNDYRDRYCLAYVANVFMNVNEKKFYQSRGIHVNDDMFALSILVQWIWRSCIRDGDEVYLYIPSRRMRTLLTNWIENVSNGGNIKNEETM